jgi:hypothetical protein
MKLYKYEAKIRNVEEGEMLAINEQFINKSIKSKF